MLLDLVLAALAVALALALRPWRALGGAHPVWPSALWAATLPLLWAPDRYTAMPLALPLSGASLLMLMCGWPLAVLALLPVTLVTALAGDLGVADGLHRGVWLGLVPATLATAIGAAVRRWLPHQLFVYIFCRGFFASGMAVMAAGALSLWLHGGPAGVAPQDLLLARLLAAWSDAFITGMFVALFVAFRPHWLATYADRIYLLPPDSR